MELIGFLMLIWGVVNIVATITIFSINGKVDTILNKINGSVKDGTVIGGGNDSEIGFIDIKGINKTSNTNE